MTEPYVSPDFNMDDIRRIRDSYSERHLRMSPEEIIEENRKGAEELLRKLASRKEGKTA